MRVGGVECERGDGEEEEDGRGGGGGGDIRNEENARGQFMTYTR